MGKFVVVAQDLKPGAGGLGQTTTTSLDGRWKDTYSIAQSASVHVARGSCRIDVTSDVAGGKVKLIELGTRRIRLGPQGRGPVRRPVEMINNRLIYTIKTEIRVGNGRRTLNSGAVYRAVSGCRPRAV